MGHVGSRQETGRQGHRFDMTMYTSGQKSLRRQYQTCQSLIRRLNPSSPILKAHTSAQRASWSSGKPLLKSAPINLLLSAHLNPPLTRRYLKTTIHLKTTLFGCRRLQFHYMVPCKYQENAVHHLVREPKPRSLTGLETTSPASARNGVRSWPKTR